MKAFERLGLTCASKKAKQAHFVLKRAGYRHAISIPDHKEVKRALLQSQIKRVGLSEQQYLDAFHGRTARASAKPAENDAA